MQQAPRASWESLGAPVEEEGQQLEAAEQAGGRGWPRCADVPAASLTTVQGATPAGRGSLRQASTCCPVACPSGATR